MKHFLVLGLLLLAAPALAQELTAVPGQLPPPPGITIEAGNPDPAGVAIIQRFKQEGGTPFHMGRVGEWDGWFIAFPGRYSLIYANADRSLVLFGTFRTNAEGADVTAFQIDRLAAQNQEVQRILESARLDRAAATEKVLEFAPAPKTPGEKILVDLLSAPAVEFGAAGPVLHMIIDPQCPFCKQAWKEIRPAVIANRLRVRLIPVGAPASESERMAAVLLGAAEAPLLWNRLVEGDAEALAGTPAPELLAGARQNMELVSRWRIQRTPFIVYRDAQNVVKIVEGAPENLPLILNDLPPARGE